MMVRWLVLLGALWAPALLCGSALAVGRDDTVAIFDELASSASGGVADLDAWVNEGGEDPEVEVGARLSFHFRSASDAYLTVIYLDAHGAAVLLHPGADVESSRIAAGRELSVPPTGATFKLAAHLPAGPEVVFAVTTRDPLSREQLGVDTEAGRFPSFDVDAAFELAQRLRNLLEAAPDALISAVERRHLIVQPKRSGPQYEASTIESYFARRMRSVRRPKLDLNINFEFDSAVLTPAAEQSLQEVGTALGTRRLAGKRFRLVGHTDDVGPAGYNQELSLRRAEAARGYLLRHFDVEADRLEFIGLGESEPLMHGTDERARTRNRRVSLQLIR